MFYWKSNVIAFVLVFLGSWLLKLWWWSELSYYILPRFNVLVLGTAMLVLLSGLLLFVRPKIFHSVSYHTRAQNLMSWCGLVLVILVFPPAPLSSQSVTQRGVQSDLSQIQVSAPLDFSIDSAQRRFADWIKILSKSDNVRQFAGDEVNVTGFVYQQSNLPVGEFYVARFLIRCCSADARPVVLRVKTDTSFTLPDDTWVTLNGIWQIDDDPEQPLYLELKNSTVIDQPTDPYIY
jgi:uncharacterized repeat protein (TIGR03943 family)